MALLWSDLREWRGSQQHAFEELCCQLLHCESVIESAAFTRKASPDGGVECYWRMPDGKEWGLQAKFFTASPTPGQWADLKASVARALEKHPELSKYTVGLPIDRADPRIEDQLWFMDAWNARDA